MFGRVAYSLADSSFQAGAAMGRDLLAAAPKSVPEVILAFVTVAHRVDEVVSGIKSVIPSARVVGCSVFGNVTSQGSDESTFSTSAVTFDAPGLQVTPFLAGDLAQGSLSAGREIGTRLAQSRPHRGNRLLLLFPDAFAVNVTQLGAGIGERLPDVPICGGLASNDYQVEATFQFLDDRVVSGSVSGLFITGRFQHRIGVSHGSRAVGGVRTITKARDNVIYEIDNEPALTLLEAALGREGVSDYGQLANVIGLGFPFNNRGYPQDLLLRAVTGRDEDDGSIQLGAEVEEGSRVVLAVRDRYLVDYQTRQMTRALRRDMRRPDDSFYLYFNCGGRGSYLYGDPQTDVLAMQSELGADKSFGGFFTFGELAPFAGKNRLHNYTGVLVGLESDGDVSFAEDRGLLQRDTQSSDNRPAPDGIDSFARGLQNECLRLRKENEALSTEIFAREVEETKFLLEARNLRKEIRLFHHLYDELSRAADAQTIYDMVIRYLVERLAFDCVALFGKSEAGFRPIAYYGMRADEVEPSTITPLFQRLCDAKTGVVSNDGSIDGRIALPPQFAHAQRFMLVPFGQGAECRAMLFVGNRTSTTMRRPRLTEVDLASHQALANQVGIAVAQTTHLAEMMRVNNELEHENELRREAERKLQEADDRKNQFLASLGHELRNPLAALVNASYLLEADHLTNEQRARVHGVLKRQLGHLTRLVNDLLDVARITRGRLGLRFEEVDLREAVLRALEITQPSIRAAGHELSVDIPKGPIEVLGDLDRMAQALANLLDNAAKYTPSGGHIWLCVEVGIAHVKVSVRDDGIGMGSSDLEKLFEPFSPSAAPAHERGGLGLGLAIVREVVTRQGGTIEAHSAGPGSGSEFEIFLPLLEPRPSREAAALDGRI